MKERKDLNLNHFRIKLEEERKLLLAELESVGRRNPDNPNDWEAKPSSPAARPADPNELADDYETYEENAGVLRELEIRLADVEAALERIAAGGYGFCRVSGEPIEVDRLEANPAAVTCKAHLASH